MKTLRPTTWTLSTWLVLLWGCGGTLDQFQPDAYTVGAVVRRAEGRHLTSGDVTFPLTRLQIEKNIAEGLDAHARFDFANGKVTVTDGTVDRIARGDMQVFGVGLSYAPFCRYVSLDLGAEVYHSDFAVISKNGPLKNRISDSANGWALTIGGSTYWPIGKNVDIIAGGGYSAGDNETDEISVQFDSYYWFVGCRFSPGAKTRKVPRLGNTPTP